MFRIKSIVMSVLLVFMCSSCFAGESVLPNLSELFDILPWNVETGEYKDGRDLPKDGGENEEKGRQKENEQFSREEEELRKKGEEQAKQGKEAQEPATAKEEDKNVKSIDLVVILDKSGSMFGLEKDTIGGFNGLLEENRKKDVPVKVTLIMFNQGVNKIYDRVPLAEAKELTGKDYIPGGTTALLDAVGNALSGLKADETVNAEGNKVLVVVTTDGYENASKEWTWSKVRSLIKNLEAENGYQFAFLGADINAVQVAGDMGIGAQNAVKFKKTSGVDGGVQSNFRAVSSMISTVSAGESIAEDATWKKSIVEDKE